MVLVLTHNDDEFLPILATEKKCSNHHVEIMIFGESLSPNCCSEGPSNSVLLLISFASLRIIAANELPTITDC